MEYIPGILGSRIGFKLCNGEYDSLAGAFCLMAAEKLCKTLTPGKGDFTEADIKKMVWGVRNEDNWNITDKCVEWACEQFNWGRDIDLQTLLNLIDHSAEEVLSVCSEYLDDLVEEERVANLLPDRLQGSGYWVGNAYTWGDDMKVGDSPDKAWVWACGMDVGEDTPSPNDDYGDKELFMVYFDTDRSYDNFGTLHLPKDHVLSKVSLGPVKSVLFPK